MISLSKKVAALTLGLFAFAAPLHAQAQFSLGGSIGMPLGDFDDGADMGFHALAAASFRPASLPVGIQVDGNFSQFGLAGSDENFRMLFATANAVYTFNTAETSKLRPYLIGGFGVYNGKVTVDGAESSTDMGINAGAGFNVMAGGAALFVEGRFHNVFADGNSLQFVPLTVGIRLGGN